MPVEPAFMRGVRFARELRSADRWRRNGDYATLAWGRIHSETAAAHGVEVETLELIEREARERWERWYPVVETAVRVINDPDADDDAVKRAVITLRNAREFALARLSECANPELRRALERDPASG